MNPKRTDAPTLAQPPPAHINDIAADRHTTRPPPASIGAPGRILSSWKEIAAYLGRGVRTAQRYEKQFKLPVRRAAAADHGSSVMAFCDEIDGWLRRAQNKERHYVRPTLLVIDCPVPGTMTSRKLVLEVAHFNVLTAYSSEEAYAT